MYLIFEAVPHVDPFFKKHIYDLDDFGMDLLWIVQDSPLPKTVCWGTLVHDPATFIPEIVATSLAPGQLDLPNIVKQCQTERERERERVARHWVGAFPKSVASLHHIPANSFGAQTDSLDPFRFVMGWPWLRGSRFLRSPALALQLLCTSWTHEPNASNKFCIGLTQDDSGLQLKIHREATVLLCLWLGFSPKYSSHGCHSLSILSLSLKKYFLRASRCTRGAEIKCHNNLDAEYWATQQWPV